MFDAPLFEIINNWFDNHCRKGNDWNTFEYQIKKCHVGKAKYVESNSKDIFDRMRFDRMRAGELFRLDDPEYPKVWEIVTRTLKLSVELNASTDVDQVRDQLSEIIGSQLNKSTVVFAPFFPSAHYKKLVT